MSDQPRAGSGAPSDGSPRLTAGPNGRDRKPQWAFFTLSGCRGCEALLLDVNVQVAPIADMADVVFWPWLLGSRRTDLAALPDGSLDAAFVAGAVRTAADEEATRTLRARARRLVAFGACAAFGGLPGLADAVPSDGSRVRTLAQVVEVDYVVPGCSPPVNFAWAALQSLAGRHLSPARLSFLANVLPRAAAEAVLAGLEPPRGTVFAGDRAVCATCSRLKEEKKITAVHRPHEIAPDPTRCLLEQGVICTGLVTRGGCGGRCTAVGLPCRGCFGPAEAVPDPGASLVSAIASTIASDDPAQIAAIVKDIVDPLGTFYRYSLPQAMLRPAGAVTGSRLKVEGQAMPGNALALLNLQPSNLQPSNLQPVVGRPAEELPRILPALSSVSAVAHHLAAARALDQVFGVTPPPAGAALRRALLLADFARAHLRRLAFLLAAPDSPLAPAPLRHWPAPRPPLPAGFAQGLLRGTALAQEALELIGGRVGMPVCALPGGVARALDGRGRDRLAVVAAALRDVAHRTQAVLHERLFAGSDWLAFFDGEAFALPLASLAIVGDEGDADWLGGRVRAVGPDGEEIAGFGVAEYADHLAWHTEPWSEQPFAHLKAHAWPGLDGEATVGLFRVGPLARLNAAGAPRREAGRAERQRLEEALGTGPWHSLAAGVWASLIELLEASEALAALSHDEVIAGAEVRSLPTQVVGVGAAAVEGPAGPVLHAYRTDARGLVREAEVFDPATFNNAARTLAARQAARHLLKRGGQDDGELRLIELAVAAY